MRDLYRRSWLGGSCQSSFREELEFVTFWYRSRFSVSRGGWPASHCYLSSSYVKRIGLHMKENNGKVVLGNGLEVDMEGTVNVHVKIQQYQYQVSCLVIKLSDDFDYDSKA